MNLMAVFTALHGGDEIGWVDPVLLVDRVEGLRLLLGGEVLAGDADRLEAAALLSSSLPRAAGSPSGCPTASAECRWRSPGRCGTCSVQKCRCQ